MSGVKCSLPLDRRTIIIMSMTQQAIFIDQTTDMPSFGRRRKGQNMRRYEIVRKLGEGSFGVAFLVRRTKDGKKFAAKAVSAADNDAAESALKEAKLLAALNHSAVVRYVDSCVENE